MYICSVGAVQRIVAAGVVADVFPVWRLSGCEGMRSMKRRRPRARLLSVLVLEALSNAFIKLSMSYLM